MTEKRQTYSPKDSGITFFLAMALPQVVMFVFQLILISFFGGAAGLEKLILKPSVQLASLVLGQLTFLLTFILYNKKNAIDFKPASKLFAHFDFRQFLLCAIIPIICVFGFNGLITLVDRLLRLIGYNRPNTLIFPLNNFGWLLFNVIFLALGPSIVEELLFRGIILQGLRKFGTTKAIFLTAFLFSIFHASPLQTIYQFILGIVLGYAVIKTGSLKSGILIHFLNNFIVVLFNFIALNFLPELAQPNYSPLSIFLNILIAVVATVLIVLIFKFFPKGKNENSQENMHYEVETEQNKGKKSLFSKNNIYMFAGIGFAIFMWVYDLIYYLGK
ncbi:MAG: type II CAAX endopeptidase family protein [Clostridia bacterium]